jgi:plasmid maintenance system killer protein
MIEGMCKPVIDNKPASHQLTVIIRSFRSKALQRFVEQGDASKLSGPNVRRLERILTELDHAREPQDMNGPGLRFHGLKGRDKGRTLSMLRATGGSHSDGMARMQ